MWKWILALAIIPSIALAQGFFPDTFGGRHAGFFGAGTASGPPPGCSNSMDFSDGCNSQYLL